MSKRKSNKKYKIQKNSNFFCILKDNYIYFLATIRYFFKNKNFLKHFGFVYLLYFIGIFGLLIIDVYHRDDIWRMQDGNPDFIETRRYLSQVFSYLFHTSYPKIADVSPITQLMAIVFLSIASIMLVKIINKKISYVGLVASLPLGLNPWYLQCLSYKYDAVFMGLATFCAILPFLFTKRLLLFFSVSVVLLLCVLNLYQTNNGIYLVITLFIIIHSILLDKDFKTILKFCFVSAFSFIVALLIYKFVFYVEIPTNSHFGQLSTFKINMIFININKLLNLLSADIGNHIIKYLFFASMLLFGISMFQKRKINPVVTILLISLFFVIGLFVSYGMYIFLIKFHHQARGISQIGGFIAIITIGAICQRQIIINFVSKCIVIYLSYSLIAISCIYANALDAQEKFEQYRLDLMMSDLEHLLPINNKEKITVFLTNQLYRSPYDDVYRNVLPLFIGLKGKIVNHNALQLKQKGINIKRYKTCKKQDENAKKIVETRFHKIAVFDNNCFEITLVK